MFSAQFLKHVNLQINDHEILLRFLIASSSVLSRCYVAKYHLAFGPAQCELASLVLSHRLDLAPDSAPGPQSSMQVPFSLFC